MKNEREPGRFPLIASPRAAALYPSRLGLIQLIAHRGGWEALGDFGASAMPLDEALQCLSANHYFLELRQTYG